MPRKDIVRESELTDHHAKNPLIVHGIWEKVLGHCPKIHVSDDPPVDATDGVDGDVWLEY